MSFFSPNNIISYYKRFHKKNCPRCVKDKKIEKFFFFFISFRRKISWYYYIDHTISILLVHLSPCNIRFVTLMHNKLQEKWFSNWLSFPLRQLWFILQVNMIKYFKIVPTILTVFMAFNAFQLMCVVNKSRIVKKNYFHFSQKKNISCGSKLVSSINNSRVKSYLSAL